MGDLAEDLHRLLGERGQTVSTAESLTGGGLAALVSAVPGASAGYLGGVVSYATSVKETVLGVPAALVAEHGVVSAPCAEAMAAGVRRLTGSTWAVSTTGVAGPTGQDGQPVGTVFVGVAGPSGVTSVELHLAGDRSAIRSATCREALTALLGRVSQDAFQRRHLPAD